MFLADFGGAQAEIGPKNGDTWVPTPAAPAPVDKDPLTVIDILIDKTAANSVAARDQAIAEAPVAAFQKLAERNLTEAELKALKPPKNIAALVQDFEIKGEQMSSTRYVAKFTVRFSDAVRNYITIRETPVYADDNSMLAAPEQPSPEYLAQQQAQMQQASPVAPQAEKGRPDENGVIWNEERGKAYESPAIDPEAPARTALVLPYLENMSGQTVLWEDPNPWRRIWQNSLPSASLGATKLIVPLGDISDIAAGSSNAVWSGDYGPVEKLRRNYSADEVLLLAANKSGSSMTVDVYSFRNGKLRQRGSINPFVGELTDVEAFREALSDTLRYLSGGQTPRRGAGKRSVETISRDVIRDTNLGTTVIDGATPAPARAPGTLILLKPNEPPLPPGLAPPTQTSSSQVQYAPGPGGRVQLEVMAVFRNFQAWVEMQKRLSSLSPAVAADIKSINANSASVTLNYSSSLEALRGSLAARGLALGAPAGSDPVQGTIYRLQLVN
ncbi:MAG: DUF2066 domain-containing protein [Alphaproteobacteria bacterium]